MTSPLPSEVVRAAGDSIIRSVGDDPAEYSAAERFEADQVARLALTAALPALEPVRAAERHEAAREALLAAAEDLASQLYDFPYRGRHVRAAWALNWLRDRADGVTGRSEG